MLFPNGLFSQPFRSIFLSAECLRRLRRKGGRMGQMNARRSLRPWKEEEEEELGSDLLLISPPPPPPKVVVTAERSFAPFFPFFFASDAGI